MPQHPDVSRSYELYERAGKLIPGWTQLISRRASSAANGVSPVYALRAKGSRFIDVDENEYVDWVNAVGAICLGHADDVVDDAVKEQISRGSIYTVNSPLELDLAELLIETIPSAEMVRYCKGGGDACAVAARIARGTTGKEKILICGYHGWQDWYQAANHGIDPETGEFPFAGIEPIGVPKALAGTIIPFPYGDLNYVEDLLKEHRGDVAAIMMEPLRTEMPPRGYLESMQEMARANDAILIFDEVSCGWRPRVGGVQELLGIIPDMTALAKCMSNGYPMGAVVGSREVMEPAGRMFIFSSYWSDNVGLVATITTINELKRRDSAARFEEIGESLRTAVNGALRASGLSGRVVGLAFNPQIKLELADESLRPKVNTLFVQEMARRGVHCGMGFKASLANNEEDIRQTAEAVAEVCALIKQTLDAGTIDTVLVCDPQRDPFRRLVR